MLKLLSLLAMASAMFAGSQADSCDSAPVSTSGVQKVSTTVQVGDDGLTVEQRNVRDRLAMDNKPGSIKHLYLISPISGQVLLYSTVKGKVTSSGKRLTPTTSNYVSNNGNGSSGFRVDLPNLGSFYTSEVLQDDGTYGSSSEYLYWWDVQGRYHQVYPGQVIIMLSDQPMPIKSVTLNLEQAN